jgi:hypothetical protein
MSRSPWSAYGRANAPAEPPADDGPDCTFGALRNVERGREELQKCLQRVLREYYEIRSGESGYRRLIEAALEPSPQPETVEERLRRLASERRLGRQRKGRSAP